MLHCSPDKLSSCSLDGADFGSPSLLVKRRDWRQHRLQSWDVCAIPFYFWGLRGMISTLPRFLFPDVPGLDLNNLTVQERRLEFEMISTQTSAACPLCHVQSCRIHSNYQRTVADLPWADRAVRLLLQVRRFFCDNQDCLRRIFTERLGPAILSYARRTTRRKAYLEEVGFALGGEEGAYLADCFGVPTSPTTLLRIVRQAGFPEMPTPRYLAVDDWAKRKGKTYGTILVDLERHQVVDLLPARTSEALASWLKTHPGVEVITRDRATAYAEGATVGAPEAIQVADRWHLLKNLGDTVTDVLARHRTQLSRTIPPVEPNPGHEPAPTTKTQPQISISHAERERLRRRTERLARYEQVVTLRERGLTVNAIGHRVGISERTVNRFLTVGTFPERKRRRPSQPPLLEAYASYLHERWAEGCPNGTQLWRELVGQGFTGSLSVVLAYVSQLRHGDSLPANLAVSSSRPQSVAEVRRYSPQQAAMLFARPPEALEEAEQQDILHMVNASAEIADTYELAQQFAQMVRQQQPEALGPWLASAQSRALTEFRQLAAGLSQDLKAVAAALQFPFSNGQAEGQVNRLKLIKRKMFGRANFDLLRQRVLRRRPADPLHQK